MSVHSECGLPKCVRISNTFSRRGFGIMCGASLLGFAAPANASSRPDGYVRWNDLQKPGLPEPRIISTGFVDQQNDIWKPVYDKIGGVINEDIAGRQISIAGFALPLFDNKGLAKNCMLIPNRSACLHFPPPPPNQAIYVRLKEGVDFRRNTGPVLVSGHLMAKEVDTDILKASYFLDCVEFRSYYLAKNRK